MYEYNATPKVRKNVFWDGLVIIELTYSINLNMVKQIFYHIAEL